MRAAVPAFLETFGGYTIDPGGLAWKENTTLRGPTTLKVRREP